MPSAKYWCFTSFAVSPANTETVKGFHGTGDCTQLCFQVERCTDTDRLHYQGFIGFKKKKSFNAVKDFLTLPAVPPAGGAADGAAASGVPHVEKIKKSVAAAQAYCCKEDTRVDGPWRYGLDISPGSRSDITRLCARAKEKDVTVRTLWDEHPEAMLKYHKGVDVLRETQRGERDRAQPNAVYVVVGPTGTGKTRSVFDRFGIDVDALYVKDGTTAQFWDMYDHQPVVLFDDYKGELPLQQLLKILDIYPLQIQYKGGSKRLTTKTWVITSNLCPEDWYPKDDPEHLNALRRRFTAVYKHRLPDELKPAGFHESYWNEFLGKDCTPNEFTCATQPQFHVVDGGGGAGGGAGAGVAAIDMDN